MGMRMSGILMHPTSLPGPYGIGDLGPAAYRFADFLAAARQHVWQVLPVSTTAGGDSPYHSTSTFAGNPLLISPDILHEQGWLSASDLKDVPSFKRQRVDYTKAWRYKIKLLQKAFVRFSLKPPEAELSAFQDHHPWLKDFALFSSLSDRFPGKAWVDWPAALRSRRPAALAEAERECAEAISFHTMLQFFFFRQWSSLKRYCREQQIQIVGDMPIYMPLHSADVWGRREIFALARDGRPIAVSGVPPDYFSRTGQLWGHPVYRWNVIREFDYDWWMERVEHHLGLFDRLRIDHFRGLVAYWEVPAGAKNAVKGKWSQGPADEFLARLSYRIPRLPLIAEDLGTIDADVRETMRHFDLPGMKVLLFAFGDDFPRNVYLPHNYGTNCVAYTGTHDNNTARGWFEEETGERERRRLFDYLGQELAAADVPWALIRLAMQSVADIAVIPMQDLLGLDAGARMNLPSSLRGNWAWRAAEEDFQPELAARLAELTKTYGRGQVLFFALSTSAL